MWRIYSCVKLKRGPFLSVFNKLKKKECVYLRSKKENVIG